MADYVIPPKTSIVKCARCSALYVPDRTKDKWWSADQSFESFESCPLCGYSCNTFCNTIPLWKYNLIKFFRGGFKKE